MFPILICILFTGGFYSKDELIFKIFVAAVYGSVFLDLVIMSCSVIHITKVCSELYTVTVNSSRARVVCGAKKNWNEVPFCGSSSPPFDLDEPRCHLTFEMPSHPNEDIDEIPRARLPGTSALLFPTLDRSDEGCVYLHESIMGCGPMMIAMLSCARNSVYCG